jgi:hypothetical protein
VAAEKQNHATPPAGGVGPVEVIPRVYNFLAWIGPKLGTFPQVHRFTVGDRIMTTGLEVLDELIVARYDRNARAGALKRTNVALERLRYPLRLAKVSCVYYWEKLHMKARIHS